MSLSNDAREALMNIVDPVHGTTHSINIETLYSISLSPTLVKTLNEFIGKRNSAEPAIQLGDVTAYDSETNVLILSRAELMPNGVEYNAIIGLAHEVGHALSLYRHDAISRSSPDSTALISCMWEGDALYNQIIAMTEIMGDNQDYWLNFWRDNGLAEGTENIFKKLHDIVYGADPKDEIIRKLAAENREMSIVYSSDFGVSITYDEYIKWWWFKTHTDLAIDYWEALGVFYPRTAEGRKIAIEEIEKTRENCLDIKTLINQAHKYYGTGGNDILSAGIAGSVLGSINGREVLWGGGGSDVLYGSSVKDILLGGDGHDVLHGNGGDDRLAGNQGHDRLFGGDGNDTYCINTSTLTGMRPDLIYDQAGDGSVQLSHMGGLALAGGIRVAASTKEFTTYVNASEPGIEYRFQPADEGASLGALYIYYQNKLVTVIKDFDKSGTYLGIHLDDNAAAPEPQVTIPGLDLAKGNHITINKQTDGRMVVADLSGGTLADYVTGSDGRETVYRGKIFELRNILNFPLAESISGFMEMRNVCGS